MLAVGRDNLSSGIKSTGLVNFRNEITNSNLYQNFNQISGCSLIGGRSGRTALILSEFSFLLLINGPS